MGDRTTSKKELREEVDQYKKILESLHEGYLLVDEEAQIYETNSAYCKMSGYSRDELLNMKLTDLRSDLSAENTKALLASLAQGGRQEFATKHQRKDGAVRDLIASASGIERKGKKYIAGLVRDVTDQKRAHQKLKETKQRFESLFENNPHSVHYMDLEGNYQGINSKLEELTGYRRKELLELNFEQLITEKDLEKTKRNFRKAALGSIEEYEIEGFTREGEKKPVRVTNFPMIIDQEIVGVFGIAEDISERKEAERKLKESEQKWQHLVEDNPQPVQVTVDGIIMFINQAGAKLYGTEDTESLIGTSIMTFNPPKARSNIQERIDRMKDDLPIDSTHKHAIIDLNGEKHFVEVYSIPIEYQGKKAVQSVLHDITDIKKKEDEIQASLEEKQIMLQEIHHRVKNNMAVICGLLELQSMSIENGRLKQVLKESQLRIQSMAMIHEKLYASESFSQIDFDEYIKELSQTVVDSTARYRNKITVCFQLDNVKLNINQAIPCGLILNELIVNCFKHAFAEQQAGTILICLSQEGDLIKVLVEDNGHGLPDNFSIEKQQTLGMKLIQTLTHQLEGELSFGPGSNGLGSCFTISFTKS